MSGILTEKGNAMDQDTLFVVAATLRVEYKKIGDGSDYRPPPQSLVKIVARLAEHAAQGAFAGIPDEAVENIIALLWQIAWALSQPSRGPEAYTLFVDQLKALCRLPQAWSFVAYEALAAEILPGELKAWIAAGKTVAPATSFNELDDDTQVLLRGVDQQVISFTGVDLPEDVRFECLLFVFFDCYLGQKEQGSADSSAYRTVIRECWQRRFRKHRRYIPTGKRVLLAYSGGLDYSVRLNANWFSKFIAKVASAEGKTPALISREVADFLDSLDDQPSPSLPTRIRTPSDLLKALLGYIKITNTGRSAISRCDIDTSSAEEWWDIVDLLNEIVQETGGVAGAGGAAVTGAETLLTLGEPPEKINLVVPALPPSLLRLLSANLLVANLLVGWYGGAPGARTLQFFVPSALPTYRHPEIHNTIIAFAPGAKIVFCPHCGAGVRPRNSDRVIVRNRFLYYEANGRVDRATQQRNAAFKVRSLFGFDSSINPGLTPADCKSLAKQAASREYDIVVIAGLQSLDKSARQVTEEEIKWLRGGSSHPKIHVEVSGDASLDWLINLARNCYIDSLSLGEEVSQLCRAVLPPDEFVRLERSLARKSGGFSSAIQALEVAKRLDLPRLYGHDKDMDIIIRKGELNPAQVAVEIRAALVAKWVVLRKLMSRGQISLSEARDNMTQIKEEGLRALWEAAEELSTLAGLPLSTATPALDGVYLKDYDRTIILVPQRWVYGALQDQLRIVGAGDTTSVVSAVLVI